MARSVARHRRSRSLRPRNASRPVNGAVLRSLRGTTRKNRETVGKRVRRKRTWRRTCGQVAGIRGETEETVSSDKFRTLNILARCNAAHPMDSIAFPPRFTFSTGPEQQRERDGRDYDLGKRSAVTIASYLTRHPWPHAEISPDVVPRALIKFQGRARAVGIE